MDKTNELFVTRDIALKLKVIGFDEPCFAFFTSSGNLRYNLILENDNPKLYSNSEINVLDYCSAPLWDQVIDWFIRIRNIHIEVELTDTTSEYCFEYCIVTSNDRDWNDEDCTDSAKRHYDWGLKFDKRYDCLKAGVLKSIEIIKN